ncbi:MAG: PT domain-containing protein, partial [Eubacteriales bacterium]|nr:PT domain-containing protein [Eubacteriales bacterium]
MKKAITVILAIFLILSLAACANETVNSPEPTGSPSEAPTLEPTDAPTEVPTPTPESSPTPDEDLILKGGRDFWVALENGVTYYCDIDGDGLVDSVLFSEEASNEYYRVYYVTITMGADPYNPYEYHTGETTWGCAWIIDSDPDDGRLEVLVTNEGQSGDPES